MSNDEAGIVRIEGREIAITHPSKLMWPEMGITKAMYLQKLVILAPYLLPYCRDRYLTTIRYPNGAGGKFFYQKNAPNPKPDFVATAAYDEVHYINMDSLATLIWLGNLAALEFHPSFEFIGTNQPAEWVLDIDPSEENDPRLQEGVSLIGETLRGLGISSLPKTSGATGFQIYVPVEAGSTFEELHTLGHFLGQYMSGKYPELFTIERRINKRKGRIYIDYVQHAAGKSLSAPYTPRGRPMAAVSTPLTWEELDRGVDIGSYNLLTIEQRLAEKGDLIAQLEKQSLGDIINFIRKRPL